MMLGYKFFMLAGVDRENVGELRWRACGSD